jgi:hypothetical protein
MEQEAHRKDREECKDAAHIRLLTHVVAEFRVEIERSKEACEAHLSGRILNNHTELIVLKKLNFCLILAHPVAESFVIQRVNSQCEDDGPVHQMVYPSSAFSVTGVK